MLFFFNCTATTEIYTSLHTLSLHAALPICRWACSSINVVASDWSSEPQLAPMRTGLPYCSANSISCANWVSRFLPKPTLPGLMRYLARASAQAGSLASRSEEHTSELQSLMRISYAVFCLKKKNEKAQRD